MLCAISGEAPQVAVASRKSGTIYEKRLIQAYISENGTEPVTGEGLTEEDLIDLKSSRTIRPRPPTLTSIPSLLGVFQEEWDALSLEIFTLKQNLSQTRQELSTALYQNDAAVRVIARLIRERDEAREALSSVSMGTKAASSNGEMMQVDSTGMSEAIIAKVDGTRERLSQTRRKRPVPDDWVTAEQLSTFAPAQPSEALYLNGNVRYLDVSGDLALIGGLDLSAGVYSLSQQRVLRALKSGGGSITDVVWAGSNAVIGTSAGSVKVFDGQQEVLSFSAHAGAVSGLALHPSGDILVSVGIDKSYVLYDLESSSIITQIYSDSALNSVKFHPDGHLIAAGAVDGQIKIFEVKSGTIAATFEMTMPIETIFFSENGTWLAAVTKDSSIVSVWDLRKASEIKRLETGGKIDCISWDYTGQFLATGGPSGVTVQQYSKASKEWSEPLKSAVMATSMAWGEAGQSLVVVNGDGVVTTLA